MIAENLLLHNVCRYSDLFFVKAFLIEFIFEPIMTSNLVALLEGRKVLNTVVFLWLTKF